jgi:hypothetical protein
MRNATMDAVAASAAVVSVALACVEKEPDLPPLPPVASVAEAPTPAGADGRTERSASPEAVTEAAEDCPDAESLAVQWAEKRWPDSAVSRDRFERDDQQSIDLDSDGVEDVVLRHGDATRNTEHLVFHMVDGCPVFVGQFPASSLFGYACLSAQSHGLCDISASMLMIHGEDQSTTYRFDGARYREVPGSAVLGPRPPNFKSKGP